MSENKRNFLVHGGILAMAGILVRIIGMFYRIPLVNIIGSDGNGIYGAAYNVYNGGVKAGFGKICCKAV